MSFAEKLKNIDELQEAIRSHGKLPDEVLKQINYKFRLEWNYTSNSMEGSTLTREETRSIMTGNVEVHGKPIKDLLEMKGHDEVVSDILKIGRRELNLSETRIRDMHRAIMHEENEAKREHIGKWKAGPNEIINYKGEKHEFVPPGEVAERMHKLLNWLNTETEKISRADKDAKHPVFLALFFHLEFVGIHPFYDGNGRMARILSNLILISYGYPPLYIKEDEKKIYYQYLADIQAYGGEADLLFDFMAGLVIRSQELVLDAIQGRSIEEPDDLDKKIYLLEKELAIIGPENEIQVQLSNEVFINIFEVWVAPLLAEVIPVVQKFNKFFTQSIHRIVSENGRYYHSFTDEKAADVISQYKDKMISDLKNRSVGGSAEVSFHTSYGPFKKAGLKTFNCNYGFHIDFRQTKYEIHIDKFKKEGQERVKFIENLLHRDLTKEDIQQVASSLGNSIYEDIDYNTKRLGLR